MLLSNAFLNHWQRKKERTFFADHGNVHPPLANIDKASTCHRERRKTKSARRKVAIISLLECGVESIQTKWKKKSSVLFFLFQNQQQQLSSRARIFKRLWSPGVDSKEWIPPAYVAWAGIFKNSMGARHRLGIGLSYRPARLHRLAELMPWHRFLGSIKV